MPCRRRKSIKHPGKDLIRRSSKLVRPKKKLADVSKL